MWRSTQHLLSRKPLSNRRSACETARRHETKVLRECLLPDPHLVEQRSVHRGYLVVPDPGGDESRPWTRWTGTQGAWSVTMRSMLGPQLPGGGGVGELRRLRLAGQLVDVRIAELGQVAGARARQPSGSSARGRRSRRAGKSAPHPAPIPIWILRRGLPDAVEELVIGHRVQAGPVSQSSGAPGRGRSRPVCPKRHEAPHGHRHVRGAGLAAPAARAVAMSGPCHAPSSAPAV